MKNSPFVSTNLCAPVRVSENKPKLLCFPYAGGGSTAFRGWSHSLFQDVDVIPVCLPGREQRFLEDVETDMKKLVARLATELKDDMTGEFAFFGISAGAMVAYELTCYLEQQGSTTPSELFVACCDAPHLQSTNSTIHHLKDDELLDAVVTRYGNADVDLMNTPELKELMLPALRADIKLAEDYRGTQRPSLGVPITTLGSRDDKSVTPSRLAQWQGLTHIGHSMHWLDGGHFLRNSEREISALISTTINYQWSAA